MTRSNSEKSISEDRFPTYIELRHSFLQRQLGVIISSTGFYNEDQKRFTSIKYIDCERIFSINLLFLLAANYRCPQNICDSAFDKGPTGKKN